MNIHTPMVSSASWTDERIELLKAYFVEGLSAAKIAERLGYVTRNAVIGKIHRLGLNLDHLLTADEKADRLARKKEAANIRKQRSRERAERQLRKNSPRSTLYKMFVPRPADDLASTAKHIAFLDLEANHCRFPYGNGPFTFCGHDQIKGSTYCANHHALCWTPATGNSPYAKRPTFRVWA